MAIELSQLADPTNLTVELSVLLGVIFVLFAWIGIRLRHALILFLWGLSIIVFILTFTFELDFVWFWAVVAFETFGVIIAGTFRYLVVE